MRITLQIENVDRLETGGQVSYSCTDRGFDIGRHEHLDWSLPDPHRVVSGKHCEVRFEGGQFVVYDLSTNGTFLNGSPNRMDKAHALRSGDRLMIGDYIISVSLDAGESLGAVAPGAMTPAPQQQSWQSPQAAAPVSPEPAWPSTPQSAAQQAPFPAHESAAPWSSPSAGMEGRHAPPSSAPGIGTPADDVWSQQGHGWGNADPSLYDPQSQNVEPAPTQPAHADPMDHLAAQPHLQQPANMSAAPDLAQPDTGNLSSNPPLVGDASASETERPLFDMPDLGTPETPVSEPEPIPTEPVSPEQSASSPFPEAPAWEDPVASESAAAEETGSPRISPVSETSPSTPTEEYPEPQVRREPSSQNEDVDTLPAADAVNFLKAFAEGAGIPESVLQGQDPEELARELGAVLQGITGDLMGLLQARSQVKAMTRNTNRTLISRSGNNALKFSPTPQMALQTMLSRDAEQNGYLPIEKAMTAAFKDIQKHHVWTYAAMQKAAARFDETLSPNAIEGEGQVAKSTFGNQKAKLWERLQERWTSVSGTYDDGLVGVFTQYFTESYEELSNEEPD